MTARDSTESYTTPPAKSVHRLAVLAVCMVWPLIWVGGLVTTYDAGMAVPDWPGTYGYNLFLYPLDTWLLGPFDLFIEHGHRLLGAFVGFVAILILFFAHRHEPRRWVRILSIALLGMVITQGLLGGMRVVLSDRTLAMVHGCVGPAFFSLCVATAVVTSRIWRRARGDLNDPQHGKLNIALAASVLILSYTQVILGARVRHILPDALPGEFTTTVAQHISAAVLLWFLSVAAFRRFRGCGDLTLARPVLVLLISITVQIALGVGTWVANYGWPGILGSSIIQAMPGASQYLIQAKGFWDSIVVTAHVAVGSLILAVSTMLILRLLRTRYLAFAAESADSDFERQSESSVSVGQAFS